MLMIREIMYCKPGQVRSLVEKMIAMSKLGEKSGMPPMQVMTDFSAERYWMCVAEMRVPSMQAFEDMMAGKGMSETDGKEMERIMTGYHDLPEATAEALDPDGWLFTGDIGSLDDEGFLRITDRKKDLFKTSQGKYVAPSAIAATFKAICPYASEMIVVGDARPYCVALVSLDGEAITDWARHNGLQDKSFIEIARDDATHRLIAGCVETLNGQLNRWEQIKHFSVLDRELSIASGDLTPSLKAKRNVIVKNFADVIERLYE